MSETNIFGVPLPAATERYEQKLEVEEIFMLNDWPAAFWWWAFTNGSMERIAYLLVQGVTPSAGDAHTLAAILVGHIQPNGARGGPGRMAQYMNDARDTQIREEFISVYGELLSQDHKSSAHADRRLEAITRTIERLNSPVLRRWVSEKVGSEITESMVTRAVKGIDAVKAQSGQYLPPISRKISFEEMVTRKTDA